MAKVIWRKTVKLNYGKQEISVPVGATVLNVAFKGDTLLAWFLLNQNMVAAPFVKAVIRIVGTGHPDLPDNYNGKFITTLITNNTQDVWHVFVDVNTNTDVATFDDEDSVPVNVIKSTKAEPKKVVIPSNKCSVKGCDGKVHAHGMCRKHYDAKRRKYQVWY